MINWIVLNRTENLQKMYLALNILQRLICHKTQQTKPWTHTKAEKETCLLAYGISAIYHRMKIKSITPFLVWLSKLSNMNLGYQLGNIIHTFAYIYNNAFTHILKWSGSPGFNPRSSHTKVFKKWYLVPLCLTLSYIRYASRGKVEQSRERSSALPYTSL